MSAGPYRLDMVIDLVTDPHAVAVLSFKPMWDNLTGRLEYQANWQVHVKCLLDNVSRTAPYARTGRGRRRLQEFLEDNERIVMVYPSLAAAKRAMGDAKPFIGMRYCACCGSTI